MGGPRRTVVVASVAALSLLAGSLLAGALLAGALLAGCGPAGSSDTAPEAPQISAVTYEQSVGPLGPGSGGEREQSDPARIAELSELLVRHDVLTDTPPTEDGPGLQCIWATVTTVRYSVDGQTRQVQADSCDPTAFEADLGGLVAAWVSAGGGAG